MLNTFFSVNAPPIKQKWWLSPILYMWKLRHRNSVIKPGWQGQALTLESTYSTVLRAPQNHCKQVMMLSVFEVQQQFCKQNGFSGQAGMWYMYCYLLRAYKLQSKTAKLTQEWTGIYLLWRDGCFPAASYLRRECRKLHLAGPEPTKCFLGSLMLPRGSMTFQGLMF